MENLYKVTDFIKEENEISFKITLANKDHDVFKAHFPDYPLLPAFLQIDIVGEVLNIDINKITRSKFIIPFLPNDVIIYEIKRNDSTYKCITKKNDKKASEFSIVC